MHVFTNSVKGKNRLPPQTWGMPIKGKYSPFTVEQSLYRGLWVLSHHWPQTETQQHIKCLVHLADYRPHGGEERCAGLLSFLGLQLRATKGRAEKHYEGRTWAHHRLGDWMGELPHCPWPLCLLLLFRLGYLRCPQSSGGEYRHWRKRTLHQGQPNEAPHIVYRYFSLLGR